MELLSRIPALHTVRQLKLGHNQTMSTCRPVRSYLNLERLLKRYMDHSYFDWLGSFRGQRQPADHLCLL
jgi:hypothetical protein